MASPTLSVLSHPDFPQVFEDAVNYEVRRVSEIVARVFQQHEQLKQDAEVTRG